MWLSVLAAEEIFILDYRIDTMQMCRDLPAINSWKTTAIWILFISLAAVCCTAEVTVTAENEVVTLPDIGSNTQLHSFASLVCFIQPQVTNVRWITPDETNALSIQRSGQYIVSQGFLATISNEMKFGSVLIVQDLSYRNAGVYVCEAMDEEDCSDFPKFSTVELVLKMTLAVPNSNVTVSYNGSGVQTVELGCEASGYIRPDSDIRWFKEDMELVEGDKYNVSFREGRPNAAQIGLNETSPSRISMLTISGLEMADVGTYSCQSLETGEAASLHLNMEQESELRPSTSSCYLTPSPTKSPSTTLGTSTTKSSTDCVISVAVAVLVTFALTASLAVVITVCIAYLCFKGRRSRRVKSGVSTPDLGSTHPATSHTNVSGSVDMYRISTGGRGDDMDGSGGDSAGNTSS